MLDYSSRKPLTDMHSQAAAYARLAETTPLKSISIDKECLNELTDESGSIIVLPISAESAGLLPKRKDEAKGSDIVLEAILEAEVANNAKEFLSQPQNQLKVTEEIKCNLKKICALEGRDQLHTK